METRCGPERMSQPVLTPIRSAVSGAPTTSLIISHPSLRQEVRSEELGKDPGVNLVGLDLRLSDRPSLARIRHHHPSHDLS